jgi:aspartate ammonia-lyase
MLFRKEHDLLGEREVPRNAYWGIHTLRASENFTAKTTAISATLIRSLALVKKASCLANRELGFLDPEIAAAINAACDEIVAGGLSDQFPLDALQGGAGTSTNMNVNEVIANRALEIMGKTKGDYSAVHPIEHVNKHQSTNDVYPTALKIAAIGLFRNLAREIADLQAAFQRKESEFSGIVTIGRTELMDAVPITLGAQFASFAEALARDRWRTFKCEERLRTVNIGGTAVGTGIAAPRSYIFLVIEKLREITNFGLTRGENPMDQTANADTFVESAGMLLAHGANLIKISADLRLLHMAHEIMLPPFQAGSSLMPGKINPVLCEAAISAGLKLKAATSLITDAASMGTLQLCEFMPLIASELLGALELSCSMARMLTRQTGGIMADPETCRRHARRSTTLITVFLPKIGYEAAQSLVSEFIATGNRDFRSFLESKFGAPAVAEALSPQNIMSLGHT